MVSANLELRHSVIIVLHQIGEYTRAVRDKTMMEFNHTTKAGRSGFYNSEEWATKRAEILSRDNHECQWCKSEGKVTSASDSVLEIDHIQELKEHPELALDNDNLRTLCKDCHNKRHNRMNYKHRNPKINKWQDECWD